MLKLLAEQQEGRVPSILLPLRYALQTGQTEGGIADGENQRPVVYFLQEGGRTVIVVNSSENRSRIPVDELRDMARSRADKRRKRGDDQERADYDRAMREYYWDRMQWGLDHQNGRQSFGPATFKGNRQR